MLAITTDGEYAGTCFYQNFKFLSTGHNNVINLKNPNMKKLCDENIYVYEWLAKMFTLIYNTRFHRFIRSITHGNDFENEIIMIPIVECNKSDEIFEIDNNSYTMDLEIIKHILNSIEENKIKEIKSELESKLKFWQEELNKLDSEEFRTEINNVKWKDYKVGDLFSRGNEHQINTPKKFLLNSDVKDANHPIAVITASSNNNGIDSWIAKPTDQETLKCVKQNMLTIAMVGYAGACFYQKDPFVTTGNNNIIKFRNPELKKLCDENEYGYQWLAKMFTLLYMNKFHIGFKRTLARGNDFENEIIMIPTYNDKFSINMMSYIHIMSELNKVQNKINNI